MHKRYLLLDRDGTIIVEKDNLHDPDGVEIYPGVAEALKRFQDAGWGLAVVTNQSGVARGIFTLDQMHSVNNRVCDLLLTQGVVIDGVYACPHAPEITNCDCRKPKPGLIEQAVRDLNFDPKLAAVVGDKAIDIGLGAGVGAKTVLVRTGYGAKAEKTAGLLPDLVMDSLASLLPSNLEN